MKKFAKPVIIALVVIVVIFALIISFNQEAKQSINESQETAQENLTD